MDGWRIYKYPLEVTDVQSVPMPVGSRPLSVGVQAGALCLWAMVDATVEKRDRAVYVVGTGNPMPPVQAGDFVGTVQMGRFVWHVFVR